MFFYCAEIFIKINEDENDFIEFLLVFLGSGGRVIKYYKKGVFVVIKIFFFF